jgi:hypothetical protein
MNPILKTETPALITLMEHWAKTIAKNGGVAAVTIQEGADRLRELQARAEKAEASAKLWEADALQRANNTEFWKARAEKTEAAMDTMATELGKMFLSAAERAYLNVELRRRAEKAEAELDRLRAEVENLKTDLFLALRQVNIPAGFWGRAASRYKARAEKAEASLHNLNLDLSTANHMIKLERDRADALQTRLNEIDAMLKSPDLID